MEEIKPYVLRSFTQAGQTVYELTTDEGVYEGPGTGVWWCDGTQVTNHEEIVQATSVFLATLATLECS